MQPVFRHGLLYRLAIRGGGLEGGGALVAGGGGEFGGGIAGDAGGLHRWVYTRGGRHARLGAVVGSRPVRPAIRSLVAASSASQAARMSANSVSPPVAGTSMADSSPAFADSGM